MTRDFDYYFSNYELLKLLSRKRAILAKKEHDKLFHKRMLQNNGAERFSQLLFKIFPPRNSWIRLKKKERKGKNALEINAIQIERTVITETKNFKNTPLNNWQKNLYDLLEEIRNKATSNSYLIPKPEIIPIFKEKDKEGKKVFRPIANFKYIDRLLISQLNKYLTHNLDILFSECSYAFRSTENKSISFSHHKAIEDIINFKHRFIDTDLWVAEYDIKKFYDCVNHSVIIQSFESKIEQLKKQGIIVHPRAVELFYSYIDCYSFNIYVKSIDLGKNKYFGWVNNKELEEIGSDEKIDKIGIPQGGALSCLIANIIMDDVDKEVLKHDDGKLFYARFCDDMVLIHPDEEYCRKALNSYSNALKKVKLVGHTPTEILEYNSKFWNSKSKAPYRWASNPRAFIKKDNVPWLSFVGYQVSPSLKVRVRKSSIKKEIEKQIKETGKVISLIKQGRQFRVSESAIKQRVRQRLLAMSVGRINIFNEKKMSQMCWTSGFRVLVNNNFVHYQIKNLDRKRNAQLKRITNHLKKMNPKQRPDKNKKISNIAKEPKYYGSLFSYFRQFKK